MIFEDFLKCVDGVWVEFDGVGVDEDFAGFLFLDGVEGVDLLGFEGGFLAGFVDLAFEEEDLVAPPPRRP